MFVVGTAGHVDHGKSALVHALTGIDPDRLREERERQILYVPVAYREILGQAAEKAEAEEISLSEFVWRCVAAGLEQDQKGE